MWIANIKLKHECRIAKGLRKYNLSCYSIILSNYVEKGRKTFSAMMYFLGADNKVKAFTRDLRKEKDVIRTELNGNILYLVQVGEEMISASWQPKIFFVKPAFLEKTGYEYYELSAWEKQELTDFIRETKKKCMEFKLLGIKETSLKDIYFPMVMPKLSPNQKNALDLAVQNGYYDYPRKITLEQLAKIMNVSLSTYQEHLRKAEAKLIPVFSAY